MKPIKPWKDLTFTDDYMFKKIMEARRICKSTLNRVLPWSVRRITYFETEKPLKALYESKGIRLDAYIHDESERIYDIEMQVRKMHEKENVDAMMTLAKRGRYYLGEIDRDRLQQGSLYSNLHPTIVIFFCPFQLFDGSRSIYRFPRICADDPLLILPDETELIFVTSKGNRKGLSKSTCALLDYMDGKISNDPLVQQIEERIHTVKQQEQEEREYMMFEMRIREERAEAAKEAHAEGKAEGIAMTTLKFIRKQLKRHVPYQQIAEDTDTSLDEVLRIAKKSNMVY